MAFAIEIVKQLESTDCEYVLLSDQTGDYNVTTNPNGYGAPNPARNEVALFLVPRSYDSVEGTNTDLAASTVQSGNDDPLNATQWVLATAQDGYYPCDVAWIFLDASLAGTPINTGDYIYDTTLNNLYRSTVDSNSTAPNVSLNDWILGSIEDAEFDTFLVSSGQKSAVNITILCRAEDGYQKFTAQITKNILNNPNSTGCACLNRNQKKWERLHVLYNGAIVLDQQNRYIEAADVIKALSDMIVDINCEDCRC